MWENLIDIKDLTWGFPNSSKLVFNNYNFSLQKWEFCVLMWKSGCGKSALAKLITGENRASEKMIYHKKEDISKYSTQEMQMYRRKLGIVFQEYKLLEHKTVKENIIYPLVLCWIWESIIESKYNRLQQRYNLSAIENLSVKFISAWEKQKVLIARALVTEPEFIIADEPSGNLDREHTEALADLLIQSNQAGNTILLITHDIHLVNYLKSKYSIRLEIMK